MKKLLLAIAICIAVAGAAWPQSGSQSQDGSQKKDSASKEKQKAPQHDPNPTRDKDVQRGYDQHQAEHKKKDDKYDVKKSGDTAHGDPNPHN
jgi:Ni/Co efflux regulator RcnB